jgi:hypothetical protein
MMHQRESSVLCFATSARVKVLDMVREEGLWRFEMVGARCRSKDQPENITSILV